MNLLGMIVVNFIDYVIILFGFKVVINSEGVINIVIDLSSVLMFVIEVMMMKNDVIY